MLFLGSGLWCLYLEPKGQAAALASERTLLLFAVGPVEVAEVRLTLLVLMALREEPSGWQLLLVLLEDLSVPSANILDKKSEAGLILSITSIGTAFSWHRDNLISPF